MALKVPDALTEQSTRTRRQTLEDAPAFFRLALHHRETLRDVAQGVEESDVGLCCSYLFDSQSGEGRDYDDCALLAAESYAESALTFTFLEGVFGEAVVSNWREKLRRARRTLTLLREEGDHTTVDVLMVHYGHPDGLSKQLQVPPLARYTPAVEERRQELVRATTVADVTQRRFLDVNDPDLEWGVLLSAERLDELARRRAYRRSADQAVTSADALRSGLSTFQEPPVAARPEESVRETEARREARKHRQQVHNAQAATFAQRVRLEAARMLSVAEERYHAAWLRCGASRVSRPSASPAAEPRRHSSSSADPNTAARVRGSGWSTT